MAYEDLQAFLLAPIYVACSDPADPYTMRFLHALKSAGVPLLVQPATSVAAPRALNYTISRSSAAALIVLLPDDPSSDMQRHQLVALGAHIVSGLTCFYPSALIRVGAAPPPLIPFTPDIHDTLDQPEDAAHQALAAVTAQIHALEDKLQAAGLTPDERQRFWEHVQIPNPPAHDDPKGYVERLIRLAPYSPFVYFIGCQVAMGFCDGTSLKINLNHLRELEADPFILTYAQLLLANIEQDWTLVETLARRLLGQTTNDHLLYLMLMDALYYQQRYAEIPALIDQAMRLDPLDPDTLSMQGELLKVAGKLNEAEELLRQAIALDVTRPDPYRAYGVLLEESGRIAEAEQIYLEATKQDENSVSWVNLGRFYDQQERWSEAQDAYRHALTLDTQSAEIWYRLGVSYFLAEDDAASQQAAQAAARFADSILQTEVIELLGDIADRQGETDQAIAYYQHAIASGAKRPFTYFRLGIICFEREQWRAAMILFAKGLARDPDNDELRQYYIDWLDFLGEDGLADLQRGRLRANS